MIRAKRPVLYVGGGAISADASPELRELAELTQIPVTQTLMGLGSFPMAHPLSLDMLGMHGTYYANMAVHDSDCLVAVGARFDDRVTGRVDAFAPSAEIIHIDIDPSSISKNIKVDIPIVGDCRRVLVKLLEAVREEMKSIPRAPSRKRAGSGRSRSRSGSATSPSATNGRTTSSSRRYVIEEISNLTNGEALVVTGVGQHQMWAAQYYRFKHPRSWCTSGGWAPWLRAAHSMGVQAAIPTASSSTSTATAPSP